MRMTFPILGVLMFAACSSTPAPAPSPPREPELTAATPAKLARVDPSFVCMVNNQYMGKAQIPVAVDGKTYFGCCEMCKSRLAQDPESRAAVDPVSGATVDKASAVIGREASGAVVYFENEKNLQLYASR